MVEQGTDVREVEWQFDALNLEPVARWLAAPDALAGFAVAPAGEKRLEDAYLDTAGWSVYRAGYALRIRRKGEGDFEATLKRLASAAANSPSALKVRREVSEPLPSDDPKLLAASDGPVGRRVRALAGDEPVRVLFRVETVRTKYRLSAAGEALDGEVSAEETANGEVPRELSAELALDRTSIPVGEEPVRLRRVEVELESGSPGSFAPFVERLAGELRLFPAPTSKFEAGLISTGLTPPGPPELGASEVGPQMSVGELAFAVLREHFGRFLAHEPGTRLGEDPEELHDMRVASRRLRAALKVFGDALPPRAEGFEEELKWIAGVLGDVRDLDVQLEGLRDLAGPSPDAGFALAELEDVLGARREVARERMLGALGSERYRSFTTGFAEFLRSGPGEGAPAFASRPALAVGPELVGRYRSKVFKKGDRISASSPAEDYHELRKRGKRLRYTLEFLADLYGRPAREAIGVLKGFQDVLGDHQDLEVAAEALRELAPPEGVVEGPRGSVSPRTFFFMGRTAARCEARAEELRASFPEVYAGLKGGKKNPWRRLERRMEKLRRKVREEGPPEDGGQED